MRTIGAAMVTAALWIAACGGGSSASNNQPPFGSGGSSQNTGGSGGIITGGSSSGGSLTGGNGGTISVTGGSSGNSGGSTPLGDACAGESLQGEQIPLDMYIEMDQSGSMGESGGNNQSKWQAIVAAITGFVNDPGSAGIGVGIGYFPIQLPCAQGSPNCVCFFGFCLSSTNSDCNSNDYATPDVPIALLNGVAPQIISSLGNHNPNGGTPTYPALQGAMQYALAHTASAAGRKTIVVLATDGAPNDCNSTVANVAQVAAAGFSNNPQILTFVIGIGNTGNLDQIAQAGGTNQALIVDTTNASQQFLDAMNKIRGQALTCEFGLPSPGAGQTVDPNQVNVTFTPSGATQPDVIFAVGDASACDATRGGWYYTDATKTQVQLCPASCTQITQQTGRVDVQLYCPTIPLPPR